MKDERPCYKCIFHDGNCKRWDCRPITRNEAEAAVKILRDLAKTCEPHHMVCVGDIVKGVQNEN